MMVLRSLRIMSSGEGSVLVRYQGWVITGPDAGPDASPGQHDRAGVKAGVKAGDHAGSGEQLIGGR